jgi:hypothetical protein
VIAGPNRADGDRDGGVRFADARWANQQGPVMVPDEASGGEVDEARPRDLRIERPLETGEVLDLGNPGLFQPPHEEAIGPPGELVLHEQIEKVQVGQRGGGRLLEAERERLGHAREPQMSKTGRELGIHESCSTV